MSDKRVGAGLSETGTAKKLTPLMQQYWQIKSAHPDKLVFFRMGDFFELFYGDAEIAAPVLGIQLTQRNKKSEDYTPMCGMPHHSVAGAISKLLGQGFKVAICDQVEDPKLAVGLVKRSVTQVLTPSMVFDPDTLESTQPNYLVCFVAQELAFYDPTTQEAFYYQGVSPSQARRLIGLLRPVEAVVDTVEKAELLQLLHRSGTESSGLIISEYAGDGEELSARGLIESYCTHTRLKVQNIDFRLRSIADKMILSESTIEHLELFSEHSTASVFSVINKAKTPMGSRLLRNWLRFPLTSCSEISARHDRVESLTALSGSVLMDLRSRLQRVGDLERRLQKALQFNAHPRDLKSLGSSLEACLSCRLEMGGFDFSGIEQLCSSLLQTLAEEIPANLKNGGFIDPKISEHLNERVRLTENIELILHELERTERERWAIPNLKIRYNSVFGYYIEVSKSHLSKVPPSYLRKQTLTTGERFSNSELVELEAKVLLARSERLELENQIFANLKELVEERSAEIRLLAKGIAELDVLSSFAFLSLQQNYVRPQLLNQASGKEAVAVELVASRHPVVEALNSTPFCANDICLKQGHGILLTGPNMAGKSTLMRQVALTAIFCQIGCFVPAQRAQLRVFDRLFSRIGASDRLSEGLSTFMVEMKEAAEILENSTADSLVILDEVGRGTSTFDGVSLAQSILEELMSHNKPTFLFATHYHELTAMPKQWKEIENAHMAIQESKGLLQFLYILKKGPASKSYGIHVAQLAGLPASVVQRAAVLLESFETVQPSTAKQTLISPLPQQQLSFLAPVDPVIDPLIEQLAELELNQMTPLEALIWLSQKQRELKASLASRSPVQPSVSI